MAKKYYWLKLQRDFFKRHDIRIIEGMDNGKDYVLFYLKLLLESIDHEGALRFSETIPYNEKMLATITNTNIDIVRSAMEVFTQLGMIEIMDDATIFMAETNKMLGFETEWAKKKREYRTKKDDERTLSSSCPPNVLQELEKEKELEKDIECIDAVLYRLGTTETLTHTQYDELNERFSKDILDEVINRIISHPYHGCLNVETIAKWCEESKNRPKTKKSKKNGFINYDQRDYSSEQMAQLEKMLISKG